MLAPWTVRTILEHQGKIHKFFYLDLLFSLIVAKYSNVGSICNSQFTAHIAYVGIKTLTCEYLIDLKELNISVAIKLWSSEAFR